MTIEEAVNRAKNGDSEGYTWLYNLTYQDKYYVALKYMKNEDEACDIMQDAYVKAFSHLETLDNPGKFASWFGMIVANTAKNALSKKKPMTFSQLETESEEGDVVAFDVIDTNVDQMPEIQMLENERTAILNGLIDSLSDEQRICIMMFYYENKSIAEIASALETSDNTVKSRLNYGKKNLKKKCDEYERSGYHFLGVAPLTLLLFLLKTEKVSAAELPNKAILNSVLNQITSTASQDMHISQLDVNRTITSGDLAVSTSETIKKTGIMSGVGAKIGITAACVAVVGTTVAGIVMINQNIHKRNVQLLSTQTSTEQTKEIDTTKKQEKSDSEEQLIKTDEDILKEYYDNILVPELSEFESGAYTLLSADLTTVEEERAAGIYYSDITDFDNDGTKEMLVLYTESVMNPNKDEYTGKEVKYIVVCVQDEQAVETDRGEFDFTYQDENDSDVAFEVFPKAMPGNYDFYRLAKAQTEDGKYLLIVDYTHSDTGPRSWGQSVVCECANGALMLKSIYISGNVNFGDGKYTNREYVFDQGKRVEYNTQSGILGIDEKTIGESGVFYSEEELMVHIGINVDKIDEMATLETYTQRGTMDGELYFTSTSVPDGISKYYQTFKIK